MIACSRMYNVFPACAAAWRAIFERVADIAGVPLSVIDHPPPAPLEELWARDDMGCVFMCGWPFAMARPRPRLIAAPVPSPSRYGGRAVYVTDFAVRADSPFGTLEDTFGGTLAWTVAHSHSGYNAPRHHLLRYRSADRPVLYPRTVGPLVTPRAALEAVLDGTADVAPLDGLFADLVRRHDPGLAARFRTVASTDPVPMPPLVASPAADTAICDRLTEALLGIDRDPAAQGSLTEVLVSRFVAARPEDYEITRDWAAAAEGRPFPG